SRPRTAGGTGSPLPGRCGDAAPPWRGAAVPGSRAWVRWCTPRSLHRSPGARVPVPLPVIRSASPPPQYAYRRDRLRLWVRYQSNASPASPAGVEGPFNAGPKTGDNAVPIRHHAGSRRLPTMSAMLQLLTGTGLAASAGMNAYIPLLAVGLLARYTDAVTLPAGWEWLSNGWVLGILAVLLLVELVADKVPAVDSINDVLQTAIRPTSGGLVFGAGSSADTLMVSDGLSSDR